MTEPLKTFKIQNEVLENGLYKVKLSACECQILFVIWRKTYNWQKEVDAISHGQFSELIGIDRRNVRRTLKRLIERKIIIKEKGYINKYGFNKNCQEWVRKPPGKDTKGRASTDPRGGLLQTPKGGLPQTPTKKRTITKNILCKESLAAFLNTLDLSIRVRELLMLFIDRVRQTNKSNQIAPGRVDRLISSLLDISGSYGEHNLITALQKTLQREGFNFGTRNVTGYVRQIAKSLYEQNRQAQVEQQSQAEKAALKGARGSKLYAVIKEGLNE